MVTDFRVKELQDIKNPEEWLASVERAGMKALVKTKKRKKVIPYHKCSIELTNALKLALPVKSTLGDYTHDQPPMEALGLIVFAKEAGYFTSIIIRYHDVEPDPVALGIIGEDRYLIACWGSEKKMEPEDFILKAFDIGKKLISDKIKARREELTHAEQNPEKLIKKFLRDGYCYNPVNLGRD